MTFTAHKGPFQTWLLAIRPRTLPAAVSPVFVGTAAAGADGGFRFFPALAALLGALLLQIGVNLANDYFDYVKGVDTADRLGPPRVTQSGLLSPGSVRVGLMVTVGLALVVGVYLALVGGWPIVFVGLAAVLSVLAYSGGPYPLASHGLGDLFVFIFFGVVAVCGTYYVQVLRLTPLVVVVAVPEGLLITAILVINNLRDIDTDRLAGKNTLAVRLGSLGTRVEYVLLLLGAYSVPLVLWSAGVRSGYILLPLLSAPLALRMVDAIRHTEGRSLNKVLAQTAMMVLLFSILLSLGLVFSA